MSLEVRPVRPKEVAALKSNIFPDIVLRSFNELIIGRHNAGTSTFTQKEVVQLMMQKGLSAEDIYANGYLNVEDIYRSQGWRVEYDKPGYNESYDAFFVFTARK